MTATGRQIAISRLDLHGGLALYQVATGRLRHVDARPNEFTPSLSYRPDSTELWGTGPGGPPVRITNLDHMPHRAPVPATLGEVGSLRFTSDGRLLVTADSRTVQVFDAHDLKAVTGHIPATTDFINWLAVSPDSRAAVTLDLGGWMRRIDLRAGRAVGPPMRIAWPGIAVFARDDTTLYASTPDGRPTVWNFAPNHVRDEACALAGRNLTQGEWHQYLPWGGPRRAACTQFPKG